MAKPGSPKTNDLGSANLGGRDSNPFVGTMVHVVLDTNAILLPFTQGTRVEEQLDDMVGPHKVHVPSSVINELNHLVQNKGATGRAARMALTYSERFTKEPTGLMGDDGILEVARRLGAVVVTNDRKLQDECAKSGLKVIVAREAGRLAVRRSGSSTRHAM